MRIFGYTIFYVHQIEKTLEFFEKAFEWHPRFVEESKTYAELDTGATILAFASEKLARSNIGMEFAPLRTDLPPQACEIVVTSENVKADYEKAQKCGGAAVAPPSKKPWGQTMAYVRDPNGILIAIADEIH